MKWLNISTGLASILAAVIALFTLIHVKNQNEFAQRADIIASVKNSNYSFKYSKKKESVQFHDFKSFKDSSKALTILLENLGLGIAKQPEIEWHLNYKNLVKPIEIKGVKIQPKISYNEIENSVTWNYIMLFDEEKESAKYILPIDKATESTTFNVPIGFFRGWLDLLIIGIAKTEHEMETCEAFTKRFIEENSKLQFTTTYYDVFNKKHRKSFYLYFYPQIISLNFQEVFLNFEIEEVNKKKKTIECQINNEKDLKSLRFKI